MRLRQFAARLVAWETFCFYRQAVTDEATRGPAEESDGLMFRQLGPDDFASASLFQAGNRAQRFTARLDGPHACYGYVADTGEVAAYIWVSRRTDGACEVPLAQNIRLSLAPGELYIWDCRTSPTFESRGLYRRALRRALGLGRDDGADVAAICCHHDNLASIKGISAAGFEQTAVVRVCRLLWLRAVGRSARLPFVAWRGGSVGLSPLIRR